MTHLPHSIPPTDEGRRLATIRRGDSAELRVTLVDPPGDEPYIRLRFWAIPANCSKFWPKPGRSLSLRVEECGEVARVLAAVGGMGPDEIRSQTRASLDKWTPGERLDRMRDSNPHPRTGGDNHVA